MSVRQTKVLLFGEFQHRAFRQLTHAALTDVAFLPGVETKEQIEHNTHHRNEPDDEDPRHRLGWLSIIHDHMDHCHNSNDLIDQEYDIYPTHFISPNHFPAA